MLNPRRGPRSPAVSGTREDAEAQDGGRTLSHAKSLRTDSKRIPLLPLPGGRPLPVLYLSFIGTQPHPSIPPHPQRSRNEQRSGGLFGGRGLTAPWPGQIQVF